MTEKSTYVPIAKVQAELGLVIGYAIVCKQGDADYFDSQGDHIPEDAMLKAATDFMLHSREARQMHTDAAIGNITFAFPMTSDIAKALDIQTPRTGLLIAMKPDDPEVLEKFRNGTFTGFSIGGRRGEDEDIV